MESTDCPRVQAKYKEQINAIFHQTMLAGDVDVTGIRRISPLEFPWKTPDPFLFCAYHNDFYPEGNGRLGPNADLGNRQLGSDFSGRDGWSMYHGESIPGFPAHPHCGFETITVVEKGIIDHSDSLGAAGRFGQGDAQWMTAGKGIQHSEMFPLFSESENNPLQLFQLWLNLPRKNKQADPHFKMFWHEEIPVVNDAQGQVKVIAGKFADSSALPPPPESWAADNDNEVGVLVVMVKEGGSISFPKAGAGVNRSYYFYEGEQVTVNGQTVMMNSRIEMEYENAAVLQAVGADAHLLVLQGKPISEPVVQHGPFVVNDQEELQQVFREFQATEFGGWPWETRAQVHDAKKGRFALYADGKLELRD